MKIVRFLCGAAVCAAIIFSVNNALVSGGLVHRDIYSGNLKYKIVMGLNKESAGTWNEEDSMLIYDEEALDDTLKESRLPEHHRHKLPRLIEPFL